MFATATKDSQRTLPDHERQEIRQFASLLPVVLLTGRTWAADITAGELGARALIRKPFDLDHLLLAVNAAPLGVQLLGRWQGDERLTAIARWLAEVLFGNGP